MDVDIGVARRFADKFMAEISSACERVAVAGSVRRNKKTVHDVEVVCIPKRAVNLFGEPGESMLDIKLTGLVNAGKLVFVMGGERYKKYYIPMNEDKFFVDVFITTPDRWGVVYTIRTGSAEFSRKLVTSRAHGGFLRDGMYIHDGYLYDAGAVVDTPEEIDLFNAIGIDFILPEER